MLKPQFSRHILGLLYLLYFFKFYCNSSPSTSDGVQLNKYDVNNKSVKEMPSKTIILKKEENN